MPTRLLRWMRSKLSAMTALTPRMLGPLAAQSREEPVPYSLPPRTISGTPSAWYFMRGVADRHLLAVRQVARVPALDAGDQRFLRRMLAKVPRPMTSWLPRRAP